MKAIAIKLSKLIGVYVRMIDIFATDNNEIYVQQYTTFNHLGGSRHCASKIDDSGCVDLCFLGKLWQAAGGDTGMGGPQISPFPIPFQNNYGSLADTKQCSIALGQQPAVSCSGDVCGPPAPPLIEVRTAPPKGLSTTFPSAAASIQQ